MKLDKNVYVMNEYTYAVWKEGIFELADRHTNPVEFFGQIAKLEIVTDNKLIDGAIEVYDKTTFELLMKELGESDESEE